MELNDATRTSHVVVFPYMQVFAETMRVAQHHFAPARVPRSAERRARCAAPVASRAAHSVFSRSPASTATRQLVVTHAAAATADRDTAPVDWAAYGRYFGATAVQLTLQALTMFALDRWLLPRLPAHASIGCVAAWFLFNSFGSRAFSPLDNRRPTLQSERDAISSRRRPSWMPPPLAFPIVWSSIGVLRTTASTLVWLASGQKLLCLPLLAFQAHLCIGDTWNCVNNQEQRLGVAVTGVFFVWASAIAATVLYSQVSTTAGYVLLPLPIWLTIASALVVDIWRLNGGADRYPLWPTIGSAANEKKAA